MELELQFDVFLISGLALSPSDSLLVKTDRRFSTITINYLLVCPHEGVISLAPVGYSLASSTYSFYKTRLRIPKVGNRFL